MQQHVTDTTLSGLKQRLVGVVIGLGISPIFSRKISGKLCAFMQQLGVGIL